MSLYLDSSLLVSLIALEPASGDVDVWLQSRIGEDLVSSGWVFAEVSSALSIKLRTKELTLEERGAAMTRFRALSAQALIHLPVFERHFATAARYCDAHDLGLRASDALHLRSRRTTAPRSARGMSAWLRPPQAWALRQRLCGAGNDNRS